VGAVISLALEFGFYTPPLPVTWLMAVQLTAVGLYVVARALFVWDQGLSWTTIKGFSHDAVVVALATVIVLIEFEFDHTSAVTVSACYVAILQVALGVRLAIKAIQLKLLLSQRILQPTRFLLVAFVLLISVGALALALPRATVPEVTQRSDFSIVGHLIDSAFTATSATCVTGLIVKDTGHDYTQFGQVVILVLIQMGGLGIMVFGSVLGLLAGRSLSLRDSLVLQDETSYQTVGEMRGIVRFIVASTFMIEAIGVVIVYPMFANLPSVGDRVFHAVFHSISAFCNAGFSLQTDSLHSFRGSWPTYLGIMPLIVLGGLGFPVLQDLWHGVKKLFAWRRPPMNPVALNTTVRLRVFSLHSRLVLLTTAMLILGGAILLMIVDAVGRPGGHDAAAYSWGQKFLDALFLSVTCRTAGFDTIPMDIHARTAGTHLLSSILMFIGGSPGSTAGGVKTSTLAVIALGVWSTLRGRHHVEIFSRTIPEFVVRRASVVVAVMAALVSAVTLILCASEATSLRAALFETVSAAGTVGLSTGLTPHLTWIGRIMIMITMLAGRLGPLTVLVAMAGRPKQVRYEYPSESVIIG